MREIKVLSVPGPWIFFDYREAFFSLINIQSGQANMAPRTGAVKYIQTYCKCPLTNAGPNERAPGVSQNPQYGVSLEKLDL